MSGVSINERGERVLVCPACQATTVTVRATVWVMVDRDLDLDQAHGSGYEYDDDDDAVCRSCEHRGRVIEFDPDDDEESPVVVPLPEDEDLREHLRAMHGTIVYRPAEEYAEHVEQHRRAVAGTRDPGDLWTPHTHQCGTCEGPVEVFGNRLVCVAAPEVCPDTIMEEPDTCQGPDGHWYVVTYGRAPYTIHAKGCDHPAHQQEEA